MHGAIVWGTALIAIAETLSVFESLGRTQVVLSWIVFAIAMFFFGRHRTARSSPMAVISQLDRLGKAQLIAIGILLGVALILAVLSAPMTADSMTYHLPRVEHWIQNRSVAPYRTNIERELWPGPGAEYIILHLEVLSRSDRVVTLVQWFAYAANIVIASLLARQLGASLRGQAFAAFLVAMMPGAVAQATGSQVELVFAFWLACAVSMGLKTGAIDRRTQWLMPTAALGAAIGIAVLTKATAYVYFAPFALWFFVASIRHGGWSALRIWVAAGVIAMAINAPHFYRNMVLYGNPLSKPGANGVVNSSFFPGGFASNILRNLSVHFGTPVGAINTAADSTVIAIDRVFGVTPADPRTTFPGETYHFNARQSAEQTAGSPIQVLVAIGTLVFLLRSGRTRYRNQLAYMLCVVGGFLFFCFYLRWQPWHARLHVPLLILAAGASGFAIERSRNSFFLWSVSALAFLSAIPPLIRNPVRPLIGANAIYSIPRERQYFAEHPELYAPYVEATDHLVNLKCRDVGLWVRGDAAEYPLWTLLRTDGRDGVRIRHISIGNQSAGLVSTPAGDNFVPCALLYVRSDGRAKPLVVPSGYSLSWSNSISLIYTPSGASIDPNGNNGNGF